MAKRVEMHQAWVWTCEDCGRDSFEHCVTVPWSDEDRLEQARAMGLIGEWETEVPDELGGDFVSYPHNVECQHCGAKFETEYEGDDPRLDPGGA